MKCDLIKNNKLSLNSLAYGSIKKEYIITSISQKNSPYAKRLMQMGFINGAKVKILRKSILGKTLLVSILGYVISVRKDIAALIEIKEA